MILGIGTDIIKNSRIASILNKHGDRFINRIYTKKEILASKKISINQKLIQFYAKRFAAKEAFAKAMGFGIGKDFQFLDISIENELSGKPKVIASTKLDIFLKKHFNINDIGINVSLTDEKEFSQAFVILSRLR